MIRVSTTPRARPCATCSTSMCSARCCVCAPRIRRMSTKHGGKGGSIVMLSSMAATTRRRKRIRLVCRRQGAVDATGDRASREVAKEGMRVNAITPGRDRHRHSAARPARTARAHAADGPARQADEVAEAILFLLSDAASYINGANLRVSGGR